ncbi:MAG: PIN domain-containing protein [Bryobacteraceae bacterium]
MGRNTDAGEGKIRQFAIQGCIRGFASGCAGPRNGLSLGDRLCLATARLENAIAVTADRRWAELDLNVRVRLIR